MHEKQAKPPMTPAEIGFHVRVYRDNMGRSQETLAELSGLNVRTIQRVEAGLPANLHTRRAIARGFEIPDLGVFDKPKPLPSPQELDQHKAEFDRKYLAPDATLVDGSKKKALGKVKVRLNRVPSMEELEHDCLEFETFVPAFSKHITSDPMVAVATDRGGSVDLDGYWITIGPHNTWLTVVPDTD